MREIRFATVVVWAAALVAVSCGTFRKPHDGGISVSDWKQIKGGPDAKRTVRWYLEHILQAVERKGSGAITKDKFAVLVGYELRRSAPHKSDQRARSWVRIQRAYWAALDKDWAAVAELLGSSPGEVEPEPDPTDPVPVEPDWPQYVDPDLDPMMTIAALQGAVLETMGKTGYSTVQRECVKIAIDECIPSTTISGPAAWASVYDALATAKLGPADPEDQTCDEEHTASIICEVCPD